MILVLFVAGPLIENLPQASLAAVVFYAATTLVSWHELVRLARFRTTASPIFPAVIMPTLERLASG